jgi:hypothetical protein
MSFGSSAVKNGSRLSRAPNSSTRIGPHELRSRSSLPPLALIGLHNDRFAGDDFSRPSPAKHPYCPSH